VAIQTEILAQIQYFSGLNPEELEFVKKRVAFEKQVEKGEIILSEDEHSDYAYFIISGVVKIYKRSANGKEQILNIASKGESLNDVSTFDGGGAAANMLAMTPVQLYAIRGQDMQFLITKYQKVALNAVRVLASRVRRDSSLVEVLSFDQVISRLAKFLIKQAETGAEALPRLTQQDLAAIVGTSRVVVNRSLRTLEERRAIRLERRHIVITDKEGLKKLVR
jgi:CRP/FNR family transcriptional regulator, cyclic AMP receptor protein